MIRGAGGHVNYLIHSEHDGDGRFTRSEPNSPIRNTSTDEDTLTNNRLLHTHDIFLDNRTTNICPSKNYTYTIQTQSSDETQLLSAPRGVLVQQHDSSRGGELMRTAQKFNVPNYMNYNLQTLFYAGDLLKIPTTYNRIVTIQLLTTFTQRLILRRRPACCFPTWETSVDNTRTTPRTPYFY